MRRYLRWTSLLLLAIFVAGCTTLPSAAQEPSPEIVPLEKKNRAPKKDLGPRALGLLRMTPSGKTTLVPVMIEINGKFYDASAYKADPVPMALEPGIVYEGEKNGVSVGLFTVNSALHSLAANAEVPWLATGAWVAAGAAQPRVAMKAEAAPIGLENNDAPPRLTKGTTESSTTPATGAAPPAASTAPPTSSPSGSTPASPPSANPPTASPAPPKPEEKSPEKKEETAAEPKHSNSSDAPAPSASSASYDDTNRPRLRRGKPSGPLPDYDVPGYSKPGAGKGSGTSSNDKSATTPATGANSVEPIELVPAISDAGGPELRSFAYEWDKGAEDERRKQMLDLAKTQLRVYIDARAKGQIPATPAPRTAPRTTTTKSAKPAKPPVEPIFENVQMHTFDLWGSNQPVLLLSADAHLPPPASGAAVDLPSAPLQYKILMVARTDIYGNLHKLHSGVTDRFHLDIIPQLDLIDAVDADGDGRGELLFRKTTDTTSGYAIYRAASDTLWKMFDTVNPE